MTFEQKSSAKMYAHMLSDYLAIALHGDGFAAEHFTNCAHESFAKIAEHMGYTIQKIPSEEAA